VSSAEDDCARIAAFMLASAGNGPSGWYAPNFTALIHDSDPLVFFNYAMPLPDRTFTSSDVAALIEAFERRGRTPRLEYLTRSAPELEALLKAAGFAQEMRAPLMSCRRALDPALPPGAAVDLVREASDLFPVGHIQSVAFGGAELDPERGVRERQATIAGGGAIALARIDGQPAGAGTLSRPRADAAEVAGVGVLPGFRRRGLAAALTARLARDGLQRGIGMIFLQAADDDAARLYERAGFARVGEILHISRPTLAPGEPRP
jgi:ribosomal protein S18 acetylase RimI-like enzyme